MFKKITISCTLFAALTNTNVLMAATVSTTGSPIHAILPSSDSLTLFASDIDLVIFGLPKTFDLQTGVFNVNFSSIPDQNISFIVNQDVTINGITHSIAFNFDALITSAFDRLDLRPTEITAFGDVNFRLLGANTGNISQVGSNNFNVQAQLSAIPEPETYAMLLAGLGLLGFMTRRRKESAV